MSDERLLETFLDLVRIDSPPGSEARCAAYCAAALESIGCVVRFDESSKVTGSDTGNLVAELTGTVPGTLLLSAHLDCVEPCRGVEPIITDGIITSAGDTVLGADDKVGLAAAIESMRRLVESGEPRPTLRAVFTVQEELGLVGAKALDHEDAQSDLCLVLDAAGAPGGVVVAAPTHYTFAAEFRGRAAHAGVQPEDGISAIRMAADAIANMELGRLDEGTTANVGSIRGGSATNVIPARCEITGECRSLDRDRVESLKESMDRALQEAARRANGSVDVIWKLEYEGFAVSENDASVALVFEACREVGIEPRIYRTGGGSDANVLSAKGVTTLALACGMTGVHGTMEQLSIDDLESLTRLVLAVARTIARGVTP
jgi:tripeptide aminopeptidase